MRGERGAQLLRTLHLIRALDGGWCALLDLSKQFQVTTRTIRRDVAFLRGHGFAVAMRTPDITDSAQVEWKLTEWPEDYRYDLTQPPRGEAIPHA